ncbi:MAG: purine-nucleoside phosphorylase, partial [Planctomycetota bacterium]|nr:purine-nucleoside phosphorylase [Planctomycetota bacterium]
QPLVDLAVAAAARKGFRCRSGVYVYVSGPTYETRAEYRMFRRIGGDVVGMSTVPEALRAAALGLEVTAASVVTNVAKPDAPSITDAHDVCETATNAAEGVWAILQALTASLRAE